jgi:predicted short-subunit dehydrogenase-like oxidoreductase (DUF2520 family)
MSNYVRHQYAARQRALTRSMPPVVSALINANSVRAACMLISQRTVRVSAAQLQWQYSGDCKSINTVADLKGLITRTVMKPLAKQVGHFT